MIRVEQMGFSYPDGNTVIKGLNFNIKKGESVGIIGANGAGKSTLLMLLMGILSPEKGHIMVDGEAVEKKNLSLIRQKLGFVFQNPEDQLFMTTVYEDVAFGPRNYKMNEEEVESRVVEALTSLGALHLKTRTSFRLSGGEKRSAAIAAVIAMKPEVLIMDEPTAALDPKARRRLINWLKSYEQTKIITSHDLDMIYETCDRVLILKDGQLLEDGSKESVLTNATLLDQCGLELPLSLQGCLHCGNRKA